MTSEDVQELLATVKKNENRHRASDNIRSKADGHDSDRSGGTRRSVPSASLRQWAAIWPGLKGWTTQYDATVIAEAASDTDWDTFREVLAETNAFARAAEAARTMKRPNAR
ncbi:hypothetical protein ACQEVI_05815 [Promicromonospora sp. CA-289599]|uniref:hypothetical protein n=1 Tax=Promicromonospora sp. CA-289599 TaxID=3240014 RepID=UPI003D8FF6DD